jgi:RNA polymerase sigma-70 factor (ECF subfamily)
MTTVVARVCLDVLRYRKSRREEHLDDFEDDIIAGGKNVSDPEREVLLADSVGLALLVVLDTLTPTERVAFVLHDMFDMPFEEIALIVGRSATATRQLASRARRRVQGSEPTPDPDRACQRQIVDAFRAAARNGDFNALLELLDPEVVVRADCSAVALGATTEVRGANLAAKFFAGRVGGATRAIVNGNSTLVWAPGGELRVAFHFTLKNGKIISIDLWADADHLRQLNVTTLPD